MPEDIRSEIIRVRGMFCAHCETRVQNALLALPGVREAEASFEKEEVRVTYARQETDPDALRKTIEDLGYETASDSGRYIRIASILIILLAVYVIARQLGWTQVFNIFPSIEASLGYGMLFVIGLLTSVHCIAMCGGINLTQSTLAANGGGRIAASNLAYNTGRVVSYTVIGGIAGGIGQAVSFSGVMRGAVAAAAGVVMLIMALSMLGVWKPLRRLKLTLPEGLFQRLSHAFRGRSSFVIGLLNGFMPCGPLQSMQVYALSSGSVLSGAASMLLFSLGTVPLMFGFGFFSGKLNRKYAGTMLTVSALLVFVMGIHMVGNGLTLSGLSLTRSGTAQSVRMAVLDGDSQRVRTEVDYGSYESFTVRRDIPVEWTIYVPEGKLNGCNSEIIVPAYDLSVKLSEGETIVTFTPEETGTIPYSCWMGMIKSSIEVVDD